MPASLDMSAVRSLTAIADCGGYHRAAEVLGTTQSTVSQHVRKLEKTLGRTLLERTGRTMRFTPDGERLLAESRRLLSAHDEVLRGFGVGAVSTVVAGSTEHAADRLLPVISRAVTAQQPAAEVRFRIDRGRLLADALEHGTVDVALLLGPALASDRLAGELPLTWCAAPGWTPPADGAPLPLVVIDGPCTIRRTALTTLTAAGVAHRIVAEAGHLAGVINTVRAGLGVALLAHSGPAPEGLVRQTALPPAAPEPVHVRASATAPAGLALVVASAVRRALRTLSG